MKDIEKVVNLLEEYAVDYTLMGHPDNGRECLAIFECDSSLMNDIQCESGIEFESDGDVYFVYLDD